MTHNLRISQYWFRSIILFLTAFTGLIVLGFLLGGMQAGAAELSIPENPDPFPEPNEHAVPLTAAVGIGYDEAIDPVTVHSRTFVVQAMQSGQVLATYGVHGGQIFLTPTTPFRPGELVYASATTGTLSAIDGTGPLTPTVWQFNAAAPAGAGQFTPSISDLGINSTADIAMGDVDGDHDLDFVLGNGNIASEVWLNEPDPATGNLGYFVLAQSLGIYDTWDVELGDLDGDGDLDLFLGNFNTQNAIWVNLGGMQGGVPGVFTDSLQFLGSDSTTGVVLGDLDGDGDLDTFISKGSGLGGQVWLNTGGLQGGVTGVFTDSGHLYPNQNGRGLAAGDVDNDGDLDVMACVWNQQDKLWINNGDATFVDSGQNLSNSTCFSIELGDVDEDGDLDAYIGAGSGQANELLINQGGLQGGTVGHFAPGTTTFSPGQTAGVSMGDMDGDGYLDLLETGFGDDDVIWLNDSTGNFSITNTIFLTNHAESYSISAGDVNNDQDLDVILGRNFSSGNNQIWLNNSAPQIMNVTLPADVEEGTLITVGVMISSTDAPSELLTLEVDWGDGATSTLDFPAQDNTVSLPHLYANNRPDEDPYTVQILVKDPEGGQDSTTVDLVVTNVPPVLENWALTPSLAEGGTAILNGEMFDPGADALILSLNWGEGMQEVHNFPAGTTTFSLTHTYLDDNPSGTPSDNYTVSMILLDQDLDLDQGTDSLTVHNVAPEVNAGANQNVGLGSPITLTGKFADPGLNDTHLYLWDLGDGNIISGTLVLTHTYAAAGTYTVTLYVEDDDTGSDTGLLLVTVTEPEPTELLFYLPIMISKP